MLQGGRDGCSGAGWMLWGRMGGCSRRGWMLRGRRDALGWDGCSGVGWMLQGRMGVGGCSWAGWMLGGGRDAPVGPSSPPHAHFPALSPPWPALSPQMCSSTSGAAHPQLPGGRGRISACTPHPHEGSGPRCRPDRGIRAAPAHRAEPPAQGWHSPQPHQPPGLAAPGHNCSSFLIIITIIINILLLLLFLAAGEPAGRGSGRAGRRSPALALPPPRRDFPCPPSQEGAAGEFCK